MGALLGLGEKNRVCISITSDEHQSLIDVSDVLRAWLKACDGGEVTVMYTVSRRKRTNTIMMVYGGDIDCAAVMEGLLKSFIEGVSVRKVRCPLE